MIYEFFTEDGVFEIDYKDYVRRPDLMAKISDPMRMHLNLGKRIFNFDPLFLRDNRAASKFFEEMKTEQERCPIRFYMPHCADVDTFEESAAHTFINDRSHLWTSILAGNQMGKTTIAFGKILLTHGLIQCDPQWEVFKDHGVQYVPWSGPKEIVIGADEWSKHRETMWPKVMRMWLPKSEIGNKFFWTVPINTSGETIALECGSKLFLKCYKQNQQAFESRPFHGVFWDEIPPEPKVQGMEARFRTSRRITEVVEAGWHLNAMSPIQMEGREDTGGQSFMYDMYTGENTHGLNPIFYRMSLESPPDWCFPEIEKERIRMAIADAERRHDKKAVSHLRARAYGDWEFSEGLLLDNFDLKQHVIDDRPIPPDATMMRVIDHGRKTITCCLWLYTDKNDNVFLCRDYHGRDKTVYENVHKIIELSNNELEELPRNPNIVYNSYREKIVRERTWTDMLDGRSYQNKDQMTRFNIGELYRLAGLNRLQPAPVLQYSERGIELLRELLRVDVKRKHAATGDQGGPRLYIYKSCRETIRQIMAFRDVADPSFHAIDTLAYGAAKGFRHMPSCTIRDEAVTKDKKGYWLNDDKRDNKRLFDRFTGRRLL